MNTQKLTEQIDKARADGRREVTRYEEGQRIELKLPEISPRTTDMMYG